MHGFLCLYTRMRGDFLPVSAIKMDSVFVCVCDLAQIALYPTVHSRDGWLQKMWFPRSVCTFVFVRVSERASVLA